MIKLKLAKKTILYLFAIFIITGFKVNNDWYFYESKSFGFKVEFPRKPVLSTEETVTKIGKLKINYIVYDASSIDKKDVNLTYLVNYIEYPLEKVNSENKQMLLAIYRNSIDAAVKNVDGKLLEERIASVQGYTGRDIKVLMPKDNASMSMRVVLVKNKMYMIQIFSETKKESNKSISRFINSFKLI